GAQEKAQQYRKNDRQQERPGNVERIEDHQDEEPGQRHRTDVERTAGEVTEILEVRLRLPARCVGHPASPPGHPREAQPRARGGRQRVDLQVTRFYRIASMSTSHTHHRDIELPPAGAQEAVASAFPSVFTWDYQIRHPELLRLYEKGKALQWNAATDIDWSI